MKASAATAAASNSKFLKTVSSRAPLVEPDSDAASLVPVAEPLLADVGTDNVEVTTALVDATLTVAVPSSTVIYVPATGP